MTTEAVLQRPKITLKLATSLDARIATSTGHSQWITGPQSRARVHQMRAQHDCILTGIGTVLADDPLLTARIEPLPLKQPIRAVLDSHARIPAACKLLASYDQSPICLFHNHHLVNDLPNIYRYEVGNDASAGGLNLDEVLTALQTDFAIKNIMIEAGAKVATSFLKAGLVDVLVWFRAPILIGADGLSVIEALGVAQLDQASSFECQSIERCGDDVVETYVKKSN